MFENNFFTKKRKTKCNSLITEICNQSCDTNDQTKLITEI